MDERIRFVARLLEGEKMTALCQEFAISRKTGYKIFDRYKEFGLEALTDRSRRPWRDGNQLPQQVETAIVHLKQEKPYWGARKIRERLLRRFSCEVKVPARSTIHAVLDRHGLVQRRGRKRNRAQGTPLSLGEKPNELWCTDYKGEFRLGNKNYCYPLTVTDHASRFLLLCEALESTCESPAFTAFQRLFQERGLPGSIRSDNGVPFASPNSLFNLSKLSVWWLRLGITIERIQPGHPHASNAQNRNHSSRGHEQSAAAEQVRRFSRGVQQPAADQALDMKCPAEVYTSSTRPYRGLTELDYPFHDKTIHVTSCERICLHRKKINLSLVFAGQAVGIKEVEEGTWLVSFMNYDLGYFDLEEKTLQHQG
jgi:transposase InsO family protein